MGIVCILTKHAESKNDVERIGKKKKKKKRKEKKKKPYEEVENGRKKQMSCEAQIMFLTCTSPPQ